MAPIKSKKLWLSAGTGLVLITCMGAFFSVQKKEPDKAKIETLTVHVAKPLLQQSTQEIILTGTIAARDPLQIGSELSGLEVRKILVEEGQFVKRNDVLARLDTSVLEANLREEQAQLKSAKASWQKSLQPNRHETIAVQKAAYQSAIGDIAQRQAAIQKAQAEYDNGVSIAQRYQQLYTEGGGTAQDAQQKSTDVQSFLAALDTAKEEFRQAELAAVQQKEKLNELRSGGRTEDVLIARGTVEQHEARITNLKAQIEQTFIRAPDNGIISERLTHLGDISAAGQVLFRLIRNGELELQAKVSADDLPQVSIGQQVSISQGDQSISGYVWMIAENVDPITRLGKIRIKLKTAHKLKSGMFVTGVISSPTKKATLVVPETALLTVDGSNFVFVEGSGKVRMHEVSIGDRSNHLVKIHKGLTGDERIVQQGVVFLSDNDAVRVRYK